MTRDLCAGRWLVRAVGQRNQWSGDLCGKPADHYVGGVAMCGRHYAWALEWHRDMSREDARAKEAAERSAEVVRKMKERWERQTAARTTATSWEALGPPVVYYLLREADGLVKIGTSATFPNRLATLRREHGPLRILMTHRGDRKRERKMHEMFGGLLVEGEWFRAEADLLSWIVDGRRRRINARALMPGTVALDYVLELAEQVAADTAA